MTTEEMIRQIEGNLVNAANRMARDGVPQGVRDDVLSDLRESAAGAVGLNVDSPGWMDSAIRRSKASRA